MKYAEIMVEAKKRFPGLTPAFVKRIRQIRHQCRIDNHGGGSCHLVSEWLEHEYGWERISGTYTTADYKEPLVTGHYWNLLPDGSILDATADQLGEGADIRVVPRKTPTYHRYRPEFSDDYNPTADPEMFAAQLRAEFPHLDPKTVHYGGDDYSWEKRLEKERGKHWGVTDPKQHSRYRAMQKRRYGHLPFFNHGFFKDNSR